MDYPLSLYFKSEPTDVKILDLCRGEDDFRKIYIVSDGDRRIVIKHMSNTFSDERRINGWFMLMEVYRSVGVYVPEIVTNLSGGVIASAEIDGRKYYTFAEEYSKYETVEHSEKEKCKDAQGRYTFTPDLMRLIGRIGSMHLDFIDWPSAYCVLVPFCEPDTTDEGTECAEEFVKYVRENLPSYTERAEELLNLFYKNQHRLAEIYDKLPTSCFQADLNDSNILIDKNRKFAGLIDFNLCGREAVLNYALREALWAVDDACLYGKDDELLYIYDEALDKIRIAAFLRNLSFILEEYDFSDDERDAFGDMFRYINGFWWFHIDELKRVKDDEARLKKLFDYLKKQMTRNDIKLP